MISRKGLLGLLLGWIGTSSLVARPAPAHEEVLRPPTTLAVYYLHGNTRCVTCRRMEAWTRETVAEVQRTEPAAADLELRIRNLEEDAHEHLVEDFQLIVRCLVLARVSGPSVLSFRKLEQTWDHSGDEAAFRTYLREAILEELPGGDPTKQETSP